MIMGNRSTGWNAGLSSHGIYALWFNLLFSASGFICLSLCMGEMSSALPFSGGVFGFVRAALGPFFGFMVASCNNSNHDSGALPSSANHRASLLENSRMGLTSDEVAHQTSKPEEKMDQTIIESTSISRVASLLAASSSSRQPDSTAASNKMSSKIIAFLSSKMNVVAPVMNQMDSKELEDYERLAVLAAGGIMDESLEEALKARIGVEEELNADEERDVEVGNIEQRVPEAA
eukprot:gene1405-biopygen183